MAALDAFASGRVCRTRTNYSSEGETSTCLVFTVLMMSRFFARRMALSHQKRLPTPFMAAQAHIR
jgi:hypothetical protein